MPVPVAYKQVSTVHQLVVIAADVTHLAQRGIEAARYHCRIDLLNRRRKDYGIALFHPNDE